MRVVPDTNVLFSALISPQGCPHRIYRAWRAWRARRFELITSELQLDEIRRASRYPKFRRVLQPERVGLMVNNMQRAVVLGRLPEVSDIDDPNDAFLLGMVEGGNADYLITGDHRAGLLRLGSYGGARIMTPTEFTATAL